MAGGPQGYAVGLIAHLFRFVKDRDYKAWLTLARFSLCLKREVGQAHLQLQAASVIMCF